MCNKLRFDDNFSHMWQDTEKFSAGGWKRGAEGERSFARGVAIKIVCFNGFF